MYLTSALMLVLPITNTAPGCCFCEGLVGKYTCAKSKLSGYQPSVPASHGVIRACATRQRNSGGGVHLKTERIRYQKDGNRRPYQECSVATTKGRCTGVLCPRVGVQSQTCKVRRNQTTHRRQLYSTFQKHHCRST